MREIDSPASWFSHWFNWAIISILVFVIVIAMFKGVGVIPQQLYDNIEEAGQFGDSFGFINALFSALAFAGVLVTLLMQITELRLQREEMKLQREATMEAAEAQQEIADLTAQSSRTQARIAELNEQTARTQKEMAELAFVSSYVSCLTALKSGKGIEGEPEVLLREMLTLNERKFRAICYVLSDNKSLIQSIIFTLNDLESHLKRCVTGSEVCEKFDVAFAHRSMTQYSLAVKTFLLSRPKSEYLVTDVKLSALDIKTLADKADLVLDILAEKKFEEAIEHLVHAKSLCLRILDQI